jgi:hypothetical protein
MLKSPGTIRFSGVFLDRELASMEGLYKIYQTPSYNIGEIIESTG